MTTIRAISLPRVLTRAATFFSVAAGLAACETGSTALTGAQPETTLASKAAPQPPPPPLAKVSIAPVIGAPDAVGRGLSQEFATNVAKHKTQVVAAGEKSDYTLRGYIVAAKDKANTKVSYIWDVTDPAGKRLNRITGEELVPGQAPKDPWTAVSPQVVAAIAQKSAASFGAWLPSAQPATAAVAAAPAGAGVPPSAVQTASVGAAGAAAAAAKPTPAAVQTSAPASVSAAGVAAMVPAVTGAPGDGATSLAKALQAELTKSGVSLSGQPASAYRVEGVVKVGAAAAGKQPIQIDWNVKDPQGKKLGTVTQKNEIPEGSLDGAWGQTASAAAAAAAQGIIKLLPR